MSGSPQVLVAVGGDVEALRLRLMVEAEGGAVVSLADVAALGGSGVVLSLASNGFAERVRQLLPTVPVMAISRNEDWERVRWRLASALAAGGVALVSPEAEEMGRAFGRAHILLVDDSVTYREYLRLELSGHGAQVVACGSAQAALERLQSNHWDCVLADLVMPGLDGADFCAQAARLRREQGQRFLLAVLSSREGKADLMRSLDAGADVFWGKSQDMDVFCARLGALLRRRFLGK